MKFGRNVLQVNTHRLTESDFRFDVTFSRWRQLRHFTQQSAATWWVNTRRLSACAAASVSSWSILHSYLFLRYLTMRVPCGSPWFNAKLPGDECRQQQRGESVQNLYKPFLFCEETQFGLLFGPPCRLRQNSQKIITFRVSFVFSECIDITMPSEWRVATGRKFHAGPTLRAASENDVHRRTYTNEPFIQR